MNVVSPKGTFPVHAARKFIFCLFPKTYIFQLPGSAYTAAIVSSGVMSLLDFIEPTVGEWTPRHTFKTTKSEENSSDRTAAEWEQTMYAVCRALLPFAEARAAVVRVLDGVLPLEAGP